MIAQPRALALPAADAEVGVVALRKDPGVAAGNDAELEHELAAVAHVERRVPFERDAVPVVAAEAEGARGDAVDAVGADDHARVDALAVDEHVAVVERDGDAVAELRAGLRALRARNSSSRRRCVIRQRGALLPRTNVDA